MTEAVTTPPPGRGSLADPAAHHPFPDLLRSHRKRAGLTQRALADLSTVSTRAIRDLEAGRANPRRQTVDLLADALRLHGLVRRVFVRTAPSGPCGGPADAGPAAMVPKPVTALRGREAEVRDMAGALESGRRRMISISGLPGVGKTRIAVEIAARLSSRRGWPVLWMGSDPRTPAGDGTVFGPLVRSLLSLIGSHANEISGVCRLVGEHEVLLVLDGVADVTTPVGMAELLAYCPGVRVVSTSRTPWELVGVQAAVISPLATPGPDPYAGPLDSLAAVPAVRLLVDRLAEVRPGFALNDDNAAAAAELCRRLDGLPLALEAVTQRFRVLSLRQLAELPASDLLDLPVPPRPGATLAPGGTPTTLGGLIGSCYERLDVARRTILRRLRSFEPPWTVADAAAFLRLPLHEVTDDLNVLIGRGFVNATYGESTADLRLPNLLRAFLLAGPGRAGEPMRLPYVSTPSRLVRMAAHGAEPHIRGVVPATSQNGRLSHLPKDPSNEGESMAFDSAEALRKAGLIGAPRGTLSPKVEEFFSSLTKEEVDVLISTKSRLEKVLPEVEAHSQPWSSPEATEHGFDATMLCACGAWSGSGQQH